MDPERNPVQCSKTALQSSKGYGEGFVFRRKPLLRTKMLLHSTVSWIANGREIAEVRLSSTAMTEFVCRFLKKSLPHSFCCHYAYLADMKLTKCNADISHCRALSPSAEARVWPEHSGSRGELWERRLRWNALVSLRETSDILGSFPYNPQPSKMLWEYFMKGNISPVHFWEKDFVWKNETLPPLKRFVSRPRNDLCAEWAQHFTDLMIKW